MPRFLIAYIRQGKRNFITNSGCEKVLDSNPKGLEGHSQSTYEFYLTEFELFIWFS